MNPAARLLRAAAQRPPRCLGLQLRPYSLGHDIILTALGNSFISGERDINDLLIAVFVCSHNYEEWQTAQDSMWLPLFLWIWKWFVRKRDFRLECAIFEQYLDNGRDCLDINQSISESPKTWVTPWQQRLKILLMVKLHMTEQEALNRPLALSNMDWCCMGELDGTLNLFSKRDEALMEYHRNRIQEN